MQENTEYNFTSDIDIVWDSEKNAYLYRSTLFQSMNKNLVDVYELILGGNLVVENKIKIPSSLISYDKVSGNIAIEQANFDYNKRFSVTTTLANDLSKSPIIIHNTMIAKGNKLTRLI